MEAKELLKLSENANLNYVCRICRIGEVRPVENSDRLVKTNINGFDIVISNDMKEGDIVLYFPIECALSPKYLSANNLYEFSERMLNSNAAEVESVLRCAEETEDTEKKAALISEAKSMAGFFSRKGRVRIIKLRGCPSEGFIAGTDSLVKMNQGLADVNWEELVGLDFDMVGDEKLCWKYIVAVPQDNGPRESHFEKRRRKTLKKFDKLIPGKFEFHYDTILLERVISNLSPDDKVVITRKLHGTSAIFANVLCNRKLTKWEKVKKFFGVKVNATEYSNIYSSRTVIKNRYINPGRQDFYGTDVWGEVNKMLLPYLEKGMTVYGEIVGYVPGSPKMIQKNHDYGCEVGEWKFMPYRITTEDEFGNKLEWEMLDVDAWTKTLVVNHPELAKNIMSLTIEYRGRLGDLYPDLDVNLHWHENFLEQIKNDKEHFLMEEKEPLCKLYKAEAEIAKRNLEEAIALGKPKKDINKLQAEYDKWEAMRAPVEGIVIRVDHDKFPRAYKVKTLAHKFMECKMHDAGEVDIEESA